MVKFLKFGWNSEMGLKFCNFIKSLKFVEDDEEGLQLLHDHIKSCKLHDHIKSCKSSYKSCKSSYKSCKLSHKSCKSTLTTFTTYNI